MQSKTCRMLVPMLRLAWLLALVIFATSAHASQKAAAESLFQEGKRLMDAGRYEEACPKFEASHKAEPSVGAMLNLARCHEVMGKTASAWLEYLEAAKLAREAGQADREQGARDLANKIEANLSKLTINVSEPSNGLTVKRDQEVVPKATWGNPVPVDPGNYVIEASAPGKRTWSETVTVGKNGDAQTVSVPALAAAGDTAPSNGDGGPNSLALAGYVIGAFGVVVLGLGIGAGVVAIDKEKELARTCTPPIRCDEDQLSEAGLIADLSTAGIVVGSACLAGGIIMVIVGHTSASEEGAWLFPIVGPSQAGLGVTGRF